MAQSLSALRHSYAGYAVIVNDQGGIVSFCVTPGNVSKPLAEQLAAQGIQLVTTLKKNMKAQTVGAFDQLMLRKRSIIEIINDQLKNIFDLEHSRHRSLSNFLSNVVAALVAYSYQKKKPSLNLRNDRPLPFL